MAITPNQTENQLLITVRAYLVSVLKPNVEVIRSQINRVGVPVGPDFVETTLMTRTRLSTNRVKYDSVTGFRTILQPTQVMMQIDITGPNSGDNAQLITTLFRDRDSCDFFNRSNFDGSPLFADDPRQSPFSDGESQTEDHWAVDVVFQVNVPLFIPQDFMNSIDVQLFPVFQQLG